MSRILLEAINQCKIDNFCGPFLFDFCGHKFSRMVKKYETVEVEMERNGVHVGLSFCHSYRFRFSKVSCCFVRKHIKSIS